MENINSNTNKEKENSTGKWAEKKFVSCVTGFIGIVVVVALKVWLPPQSQSGTYIPRIRWRGKRDVTFNSAESKPFDFKYFNTYSTEIITLLVIVMIKYILTGLIFWYSKKGKYKLILPYLMFLIVTINVLLIFFLYITIQNFQISGQNGFLVLTCGFIIIGNGVYFWVIMYRRYQNLKDIEYLLPVIS